MQITVSFVGFFLLLFFSYCLFLIVVFVSLQIHIIEQIEDKVILKLVLHFSEILN